MLQEKLKSVAAPQCGQTKVIQSECDCEIGQSNHKNVVVGLFQAYRCFSKYPI